MAANWNELTEEHGTACLRAGFWSMAPEARSRMLDMLGAPGAEERRWWEELLSARPAQRLS